MKKRCIVYGNCQTEPIRRYLMASSTFNRIYTMIYVPSIHRCNHRTGLEQQYLDALYDCDLFIYQKISPSYNYYLSSDYMLDRLPNKCTKMSFTNSYFSGYYPQHTNKKLYPYADKNIIKLLNEGFNKEDIISILSDDNFYSFDEVKTNLDNTIQELKRRDRELDITLDDYIKQNYKDIQLFYTVNHPSYHIIKYLAMKILHELEISKTEISHIKINDVHFKNHIHPIYPSVIKHLKLNFIKPEDGPFVLNHIPLTFYDYLAKQIDFLKLIQK
ncbi:WcbI family polysaccharide biosynthesis putative acetyltransferase [Priestia megaterium]|uniref:WcbI family polysaccharide biosynthesis putative acetyltransferase n=1 Tax=Priestia megaterium TaxID=1404 RepID=UPI0013EC2153|nr:WcbI family polysaccharide biosynthesis putative acetyltransferase [Priestia megaterium]